MNAGWWTALAAIGSLVLVQIGLVWRLLSLRRLLRQHDEKLGHLSDALSLLTETAESGFRAVATELDRFASGAPRRPGTRTVSARIASAARRGRSVQEIAAAEQVSEGEVRLRLHLAEQAKAAVAHEAPPRTRGRREQPDGQVQQ